MDILNCQTSLSDLGEILLHRKEELKCSASTIRMCKYHLNRLQIFMNINGFEFYTPDIGVLFLTSLKCRKGSQQKKAEYVALITQLNDCLIYGYFKSYHCRKIIASTPTQYVDLENQYLKWCEEKGNVPSTIKNKKSAFSKWFCLLESVGCSSLTEINPGHVTGAVLKEHYTGNYGYIREILKYLAQNDLVKDDLSILIPKQKREYHLPTTYDKDERKRLEMAPDRTTSIGKRDYAIILLANRLGIRCIDICHLTFDNLNLDDSIITFEMAKTKEPYEIYLLDDVKSAIIDYIENGRPAIDDKHIFTMHRSPYAPISRNTIYGIVSKVFRQTGIDTSNKKHGAHSLRSSLATDMVNTGETYEQTRKVLGHRDPNAIRHYARLDREKLRLCALEAREPSGYFERFLNGEVKL